jgi:hypothetical protein
MPDLMQKQPADSHSKWSKDGARLTATQDSIFDWRELGAQASPFPYLIRLQIIKHATCSAFVVTRTIMKFRR